jgi:hypothetical protein
MRNEILFVLGVTGLILSLGGIIGLGIALFYEQQTVMLTCIVMETIGISIAWISILEIMKFYKPE